METLVKIQSELKAPKDLFNKFGGYHYRSAESITFISCLCWRVPLEEAMEVTQWQIFGKCSQSLELWRIFPNFPEIVISRG